MMATDHNVQKFKVIDDVSGLDPNIGSAKIALFNEDGSPYSAGTTLPITVTEDGEVIIYDNDGTGTYFNSNTDPLDYLNGKYVMIASDNPTLMFKNGARTAVLQMNEAEPLKLIHDQGNSFQVIDGAHNDGSQTEINGRYVYCYDAVDNGDVQIDSRGGKGQLIVSDGTHYSTLTATDRDGFLAIVGGFIFGNDTILKRDGSGTLSVRNLDDAELVQFGEWGPNIGYIEIAGPDGSVDLLPATDNILFVKGRTGFPSGVRLTSNDGTHYNVTVTDDGTLNVAEAV